MDVNSAMEVLVAASVGLVSNWGLSVVGAIAVLIIGRWVAGLVRKSVTRGLEKASIDTALIPFLSSLTYYAVLAVVVIAVLTLFGIETTSLIAVLGAASLAVGLALQGTLSNFAAGAMLLVFRPFRPGDFVQVAGESGSVAEVGIFTTLLNTGDNIRIVIPNAAIYGATIKNYSANENRRIDMVMGISYDDDIGQALDVITRVVTSDARALVDPAPTIGVAELAESSVNIAVRPWCARSDYWDLKCDLLRELKEQLEAAGCSIPYPQHDVHVIPDDEAAA